MSTRPSGTRSAFSLFKTPPKSIISLPSITSIHISVIVSCLFLSKLSVGSNLFFFSVPGSQIWVNLLYNWGGKCKFMHWLKETWNTVAGKKYVWIIQSKLNTNHINKQSVCINTNYDTFPFKSIWIPRLMTSPKVNWILLMTWEKSSEFTFALKI